MVNNTIGIITYDIAHKKTQDVVYGLKKRGYKKITLIIKKFHLYKNKTKPIFDHRPYQFEGLTAYELAEELNLRVIKLNENANLSNFRKILICGAGLLDKRYIIKNHLINCHSGLIPETRGLDSFKWAIFNNKYVGNTLHYIDQRVDLGKIIYQEKTKICNSDNIKNFSKRHYKREIQILINFDEHLMKTNNLNLKMEKKQMRMPKETEIIMIKNFANYKKKFLI